MLLENGKYPATVRDVHLYERGDNKRLTAAFRIEAGDHELIHREWIELNDGTISDKTHKRLRQCFPAWDGTIEALDEGFCCKDIEVDVIVENEPDQNDPGKLWTRTKMMFPRGGQGGGEKMPEKLARSTLVSKYASRFRALSGGTPPAKQPPASAPPNPPPPAVDPKRPAAPEKPAPTSTPEACWAAICSLMEGKPREKIEINWFKILNEVIPGKDSGDFTPEDWGKVLPRVSDDLPF